MNIIKIMKIIKRPRVMISIGMWVLGITCNITWIVLLNQQPKIAHTLGIWFGWSLVSMLYLGSIVFTISTILKHLMKDIK